MCTATYKTGCIYIEFSFKHDQSAHVHCVHWIPHAGSLLWHAHKSIATYIHPWAPHIQRPSNHAWELTEISTYSGVKIAFVSALRLMSDIVVSSKWLCYDSICRIYRMIFPTVHPLGAHHITTIHCGIISHFILYTMHITTLTYPTI